MKSNNIIKLVFSLLIAFFIIQYQANTDPLSPAKTAIDQEHSACITNARGVYPSILSCIQDETDKHKKNITDQMNSSTEDPLIKRIKLSIDKSSELWETYINEKCAAYNDLGGQRAELLKANCTLDEVVRREAFIKNIILEADI